MVICIGVICSHVHAAYASFLWETEDEEDDQPDPSNVAPSSSAPPLIQQEIAA